MKKRVLSLIFSLLATGLFAASQTVGGITWQYTVSGGKAQIYRGSSSSAISTSISGAITIPSTLGGYPVTSIGDSAFRYCSRLTSVTIPEGVTSIGDSAFGWCSGLTSVVIPSSVTSIRSYAFYKCSSLTSVTIPSSVTSIGDGAFYDCSSLTSVTIPEGVTSIGDVAFYNCSSLTSVAIPSSVTTIGTSAFYGCSSLTSVTIPEGVTSIGDSAFGWCSGLTSVVIPSSVTSIGSSAFKGCTGVTSVTIPSSVTSIGDSAFYDCSNLTSIKISSSVTSIGHSAFEGCSSLTAVTIPSSVTSIEGRTFYNCSNLTSVTIPEGVTSIGDYAFYGCSSLTSVTIPSSVTSIGRYAFYNCIGLTSVTIPSSVTTIGDFAFYGCSSLTSVTIPSTVTTIGSSAFFGVAPETLTAEKWPGGSMSSTNLKMVIIPEGVSELEGGAFSGCSSLTSVTIPSSVTSIGDNAFKDCSALTSVTIPEGVISIGSDVFDGCSSITKVKLPLLKALNGAFYEACFTDKQAIETERSIKDNGVRICESASMLYADTTDEYTTYAYGTNMYFEGGVTYHFSVKYDDKAFVKVDDSVVIAPHSSDVQAQSGSIQFETSGWHWLELRGYNHGGPGATNNGTNSSFLWWTSVDATKRRFTAEDGKDIFSVSAVLTLSAIFGDSCANLQDVELVGNGDKIPGRYYEGCTGLTSVAIPNGVTSIGASAFNGCSNLISVTIPSSVTSIGNEAFNGCLSLTSVTIPEGVTSIGDSAFSGCSSLTSITIPSSATSIGKNAFPNSVSITVNGTLKCSTWPANLSKSTLASVEIPDGTTEIPETAFSGCTGLTSVTISEGVTSIGGSAFYGCTGLTSVTIPSSVTSIGDFAFSGCSGLTSLVIPASVTTIGERAFLACCALNSFSVEAGSEHYAVINGLLCSKDGKTLIACPNTFTSATIPSSVTSITASAFEGCTKLTTVAFPEGICEIGNYAFKGCSELTAVMLPEGVAFVTGEDSLQVFAGCAKLKEITIPCNLTPSLSKLIPDAYATLEHVTLTSGDAITANLFMGCTSLQSIEIPEGVTAIGNSAFRNCSGLTSVTIPSSVTSIGNSAFQNCSLLSSVVIPEGVTTIGEYAFSGCRNLTSVLLPSSLTAIGNAAFSGCGSLSSLMIPNGVKTIGNAAFSGCSGLTLVTIPSSVTSIGDSAFNGCVSLTSMTIPNGVKTIGASAFYNCSGLTSIEIPASVTSIGNEAFRNCSGLTTLMISHGVKSIGANAFSNCRALISVIIPSSVTSFGSSAFSGVVPITLSSPKIPEGMGTSKLKTLTFADGVTSVTSDLLSGYKGAESIVIPSSVTSIGDGAFKDFTRLTSVTIAEGIKTIGSEAFKHCSNVAKFTLPASLTEIGDCAFTGCQLVDVAQGNEYYESVDGVLLTKAKTLDGINIDDNVWLLHFPIRRGGTYVVPEHVHTIGDEAFAGNEQIEVVTLPAVTVIRPAAFKGCSALKYCFAMDGLLRVQKEAFAEASALTTFTMPASVERLEWSAFRNCSSLAIVAFRGAPPAIDAVSEVETSTVFSGANYDHQMGGTYPSEFASLWQTAFGNGGMWDGLRMIPAENYINTGTDGDFRYTVYNGETTITGTARALSDNVNIPHYLGGCLVTEIAERALDDCYLATSLSLPVGIKSFPNDVFLNCWSLESFAVAVENLNFSSVNGLLLNNDETVLLAVPQTTTMVVVPETVTTVGSYSFAYCEFLPEVYLPKSLTTVESFSFEGCNPSLNVIFGGSVPTTVSDDAFEPLNGYYSSEYSRIWSRALTNGRWKNLKMTEHGLTALSFVSWDGSKTVLKRCPGSKMDVSPLPTRPGYSLVGWTPALPSTTPKTDTTYTAQWQINRYTMTFDANSGVGGTSVTQDYDTTLVAPSVTREGYTFLGWSPTVPTTVPVDDATFIAQWQVNQYAMTFEANGGQGGKRFVQDWGSTLTAPAVTREGYTFLGWSPAVPMTVPSANTTYTAQWKVNQYTASFNANGGSGGASVTQDYGTTLVAPSVTREGYTFLGWTPSVSTTMPAVNKTYTAQWGVNRYTIIFDANGGEGGTKTTLDCGATLIAPVVTREGYTFLGWSPAVPSTAPSSNTTYTAQWRVNQYTQTFDANGGEGGGDVTLDYGVALVAPTVTREGYTFLGWSPSVPSMVPATNTTYIAQWQINQYKITFDAAGGEGGSSVTQDYGTTLVAPTVNREGYTFLGWSPTVPATTPAANVTYTAQWQVNQYTQTFDANGGEGGGDMTLDYGVALVAPIVTREGYTFLGWSPSVPSMVPATNTAYIAQWQINQYTITFDAAGGEGGTSVTQDYGSSLEIPVVTREGYLFMGWSPTPPTIVPSTNITCVAQWRKACNVVVHIEGSGTVVGEGIYPEGAEISLTATPSEKSVFCGWSTTPMNGNETLQLTVPGEGLTLTAYFMDASALDVYLQTHESVSQEVIDARVEEVITERGLLTRAELKALAKDSPVVEVKNGVATLKVNLKQAASLEELSSNAVDSPQQLNIKVPDDEKVLLYKVVKPSKE